jgi:hypothetical protein
MVSRIRVIKALLATLLLTALPLAGCAGVEMGASPATMREQALCEQSRGGGVWVAAAGACVRGGGAM